MTDSEILAEMKDAATPKELAAFEKLSPVKKKIYLRVFRASVALGDAWAEANYRAGYAVGIVIGLSRGYKERYKKLFRRKR